jgi:NDP-sugar pyrophosphorylase family protein
MSFPRKTMLLAAGLGERLRPLTLTVPKPLIPIAGRPLIEYNLTLLKKFGVQEVMINLYHLGEKIQQRLGDGKKWGIKIHYSEEKELLGTGGGVKAVADFFGEESFFLLNADILIDLNLEELFSFHTKQKSLATLVVAPSDRPDVTRKVFVGENGEVLKIDREGPQGKFPPMIFTGAQIVESEVLAQLPPLPNPLPPREREKEGERGKVKKSCIIEDAYIPLMKLGKKLSAYVFKGYWRDLGTLERYESVKKEFEKSWPYTTLSPDDFIDS